MMKVRVNGEEQMERKELKKRARHSLKKHYLLFVIVCLLAAFIGTEFTTSMNFTKFPAWEASFTGTQTIGNITGLIGGGKPFSQAITMALTGNIEGARNIAKDNEKVIKSDARGNRTLGRTRGVMAAAINGIVSGAIEVTVIAAVFSIFGSGNGGVIALIVGSLFLMIGIWFWFINTYMVIERRVFLESRVYERVGIRRFLYLIRVKKWTKAAFTMFLKWLLHRLWCLTIVGGFVKRYSYYMVPYIVAENPDINAMDAIRLSRKMMDGHKWECFKWECTYIGWYLLSAVTSGLLGVFYVNPYKTALFAEYYAVIRAEAKGKEIEGVQQLNDRYLFEKPETIKLEYAYKKIRASKEEINNQAIQMEKERGFRGKMEDLCGIVPFYGKEERKYEEIQRKKVLVQEYENAMEGREYPDNLFPIPEKEKRKRLDNVRYMRHYSVESLVAMFLFFSFAGWVWEVSMHLVSYGTFVNRGVLHGPWLPIYGVGGVLTLTLLNKLRSKPFLEFFGIIILCGFVEYGTSYVLQWLHHGEKWWDYEGYFLNLNGRICAEGLLAFGLGGIIFVYMVAPLFDNVIRKVSEKTLLPFCILCSCLLLGDIVYSAKHPNMGDGITNIKAGWIEQEKNMEI